MTIAALESYEKRWNATGQAKSRRPSAKRRPQPARPDPMAVFAHDVRGPLAKIALLLESVQTRATTADLDMIRDRADRAMQIIEHLDGLLSGMISRVERTADPLAAELWPVSAPDLIEQIVALNGSLAGERGVRVHAHLAEPLVVQADGHLLMQAIDNVVTNAIKHSPRGGLVSIEAMPEGDVVVIRVEDEGPGFTGVDMARAFRPFVRLSAKSDAPMPSTGLGLSIVKTIMDRHGGSVAIGRARGGQGAAVTLRLPQP